MDSRGYCCSNVCLQRYGVTSVVDIRTRAILTPPTLQYIETLGTSIPTQNSSVQTAGSKPPPDLSSTNHPTFPSATVRFFFRSGFYGLVLSSLLVTYLPHSSPPPPQRHARTHAHTHMHTHASGPTSCAGKGLALLELRTVICSLIQKFDFELAPGFKPDDWERNLMDCFILVKGELPVRVKTRRW